MTTSISHQTSLRKLLENAALSLRTHHYLKDPEVKSSIDEILSAAELGSIGSDVVADISIGRSTVRISTTYTTSSDGESGSFEFPTWLIDGEEPLTAARGWGIGQKLLAAERRIENLRDQIIVQEAIVQEQRSKIQMILDGRGDEL